LMQPESEDEFIDDMLNLASRYECKVWSISFSQCPEIVDDAWLTLSALSLFEAQLTRLFAVLTVL
jgi:hypothetical protein